MVVLLFVSFRTGRIGESEFSGAHTHQRPDQAKLVGVPPRLRDLVCVPLRRSPVQGLACVNQVVEGAHRLLHGRVPIRAMGVNQVDVLQLESLEGLVHALNDVLPRQAAAVNLPVAKSITPVKLSSGQQPNRVQNKGRDGYTYLGGDDDVVPLPAKLLDGLAHNLLGFALSVPFGAVEKVDAAVVRGLHTGICALTVDVPAVGEPAAE